MIEPKKREYYVFTDRELDKLVNLNLMPADLEDDWCFASLYEADNHACYAFEDMDGQFNPDDIVDLNLWPPEAIDRLIAAKVLPAGNYLIDARY